MAPITFAILTVSDSCYAKTAEDRSGPKLAEAVLDSFPECKILVKETVPDTQAVIAQFLVQWSCEGCDVILTTGGTGFSPRDVTPEATRSVIDKEAPGLSIAMISRSLGVTDTAMLSRAVCGIKSKTLIINLPGSVKAATECFEFVKKSIPHAVALIKGKQQEVRELHAHIQKPTFTKSKVKVNQVAFRNRNSPYSMYEVPDAINLIFSICPKGQFVETVDISKCLQRVLAEDVFAVDPLPPFNASTKDGYAVRSRDGAGIRTVRNVVAAGDTPSVTPLAVNEIIRINTGAPVPEGADAVVQVEDTALVEANADGSEELLVEIKVPAKPLQDIRLTGSDIQANSLVIPKCDTISPGHVGVLATIGKTKLKVYKQASIGIISTGNELQEPHETLKPGHIRDSNKLTLISLLNQYGFGAHDCGVAKDDPDNVREAFAKALSQHDVVITTGGVSMGEFDIIKQVLHEDFGATIHFGRVNMKPGKPTTFASCSVEGKLKLIFGLPGNPASAMVTSLLFVIPTLRHFENFKSPILPQIPVQLAEDVVLDIRPEYVRISITNSKDSSILKAFPVGNQISSRINSFVGANGLLCLPSSKAHGSKCTAGEALKAIILEPLGLEF